MATQYDMAVKRILKDHANLLKQDVEGLSAEPEENDVFRWNAIIIGPNDTPFEGGVYKLHIQFPKEYPNKAPYVVFLTRVFHPNIFTTGEICVDILGQNWKPIFDISNVLLSIQSLLCQPDLHMTPEGGANIEAEKLFVSDRKAYNRKVRDMVRQQDKEEW